MEFSVQVPGSCGELSQGSAKGEAFLIPCPIDVYTTVQVSDRWQGVQGLGPKAQRALQMILQDLGKKEFPWGMKLTSDLPQGKGMASSSADIAAVMAAVQYAFIGDVDERKILSLAVQIEPTDSTFLPGLVVVNPVTGETFQNYGMMGDFRISVFDTGGVIDTQKFYQRQKKINIHAASEEENMDILYLWLWGFRDDDEKKYGEAMVRSARLNQRRLYKKDFEPLLKAAKKLGALAVNVAHSGTVMGVFWPLEMPEEKIDKSEQRLRAEFPDLSFWRRVTMQQGGIFIQSQPQGVRRAVRAWYSFH